METFIPYMVKCSINSARDKLVNGIPEWWSSVVPYQFPLQKPIGLSQIGYLRHLSSIVYSCYWYHNAQYLLSFSEKVSENPESVCIRKNEDNTTSIFYVQNTVLISKFSSENNVRIFHYV